MYDQDSRANHSKPLSYPRFSSLISLPLTFLNKAQETWSIKQSNCPPIGQSFITSHIICSMASTIGQSHWHATLVLFSTLLLLLPLPSHSADPDPLQDFCIADFQGTISVNGFPCKPASNVTSDDFFFDGLGREGNTNNSFGRSVAQGNVLAFPGLNTLGISMNRVDIAPGGLNPPHSHPRATESGIVIQGKLLVGLITTGNVFYAKNLTAGQMFVIPRGLVHFQMNIGQEKALIFTAFNSHLPGAVLVSTNLFGSTPSVPDDVLTKAFQVDKTVIDEIKSKFGG